MAIDKVTSASIATDAVGPTQLNEASNYAFTGTVTGAGESNTPSFYAYLGSGQSLSNTTLTKLNIDAEVFDTANAYDNSSNMRYTPQTAGKYFVFCTFRIDSGSDDDAQEFKIKKNGSTDIISITYRNEYYDTMTGQAVVDMNGSSDYLEMYGYVSGGTRTVAGGLENTNFGAFLLST